MPGDVGREHLLFILEAQRQTKSMKKSVLGRGGLLNLVQHRPLNYPSGPPAD